VQPLVRRVNDIAAAVGFSGVVRLDRNGSTVVDRAYGLADRAHGIEMTTSTQLAMASGSKTFTALVVLKLVEERVLSLSTTARQLLRSDLPLIADDVTVEHLLSHRSGIGDYLDEDVIDSDDYPLPISVHRLVTTEDYLQVLDGHPTKFPAGTAYSYSNGGFVVLALLAERASGRTYHDLVRETVCVPAGMADTAFLRSDALPGTAASGYVEDDAGWRTNVFHLPVVGTGDGGMYTTSADLSKFWRALLDGRIIRSATLRMMLDPRSPIDENGQGYGLGCRVWPEGGHVALSGGDAGVRCWSSHDRRQQLTATVIGNTGRDIGPLVDALQGGV
jgi:CubicO group peptidase (beta-lactamase class C family)